MSDTTLEINSRIAIPLAEFEFAYARSSGPGGQNVNKVNSKVHLRWQPTRSPSLPADVLQRFLGRYRSRLTIDGELLLSSQRFRDQARNVDDCLEKLRELVRSVAQPPVRRKKTKPTRGMVERRLKEKKADGAKKQQRRWKDRGD